MIQIVMAMLLDFAIGDPPSWPHPIRFVGMVIKKLEKWIRQVFKNLYVGGFFLLIGTYVACLIPFIGLKYLLPNGAYFVVQLFFMYSLLATKCLADEGKRMKKVLETGDIVASRKALSWLVGRDTTHLDEEAVVSGCVETLAENTIDGTIAPIFYMIVGAFIGDPLLLLVIYKATNTLDSMVGYIQEPYKEIGFFSAKTDDVLNYLPARIGALVMLLSGAVIGLDFKNGWHILKRDRRNHKSPNCAYPEAVVAGLLNVQLGGTHTYFGQVLVKPTIGDRNRVIEIGDISSTINVLYLSQLIIGAGLVISAFLMWNGGRI